MLPYYTLAPAAHRLTVGVRQLSEGPIIEIDQSTYGDELALKAAQLAELPAYYFQALPATQAAQWEALAAVLADLARSYPHLFTLTRRGAAWCWRNGLTGRTWSFAYGDATTLPYAPLDWVGREVQEDLLLLEGAEPFALVAGQLCFPNRWSLEEKLGGSFAAIHEPVPGFAAEVGRAAGLLLARLKPGRPVWRYNWALTVGDELDLSTRVYPAREARRGQVTAANCGELCCFRAERQTLTRLPQTGAVLFTVHTYRTRLGALAADPVWAAQFAAVLAQMEPELLRYKGVAPVQEAVQGYLAHGRGPGQLPAD